MKYRLLVFIFLMCCLNRAEAYHIAGGDLTTKWLFGNTFEIKLTLYRDCSNPQAAPFNSELNLSIFNKANDVLVDTLHMDLGTVSTLSLTGSACAPPPNVCMEQGEYIADVQLADNPAGYYLVWERCCRNSTIVNLENPDQVGMAFYHEMADPALHNSSPVFISPPLPYVCSSQFFIYSFQATDADNDSLVYQFTDPLGGGHTSTQAPDPFSTSGTNSSPGPQPYTNTIWAQGYDITNICGSAQPLVINSSTGVVEGTPDNVGQYAMAVNILEYRNGILIGKVRREIEFYVIPCTGNTAPNLSPDIVNKHYEIYATDTICFDITASDPNGDSLFIIHDGEVFANSPLTTINAPYATTHDTSGIDTLSTTFCWKTICDQSRDSAYQITYTIHDNGCPLPLASIGHFSILVKPVPVIQPPILLCMELLDSNSIAIHIAGDTSIIAPYFSYYTFYRSINGGSFTPLKNIIDPATLTFYDSTAIANHTNNYCYIINGTNTCGVIGGFSDTLCSFTSANNNKNYFATVTVDDPYSVRLKWESFPDGPYSIYSIYRHENGTDTSTFVKIINLQNYSTFEWTDHDVQTGKYSYCYRMINEDVCHNFSPYSDETCSILLQGKSNPFVHELNWSAFIHWRGDVDKYNVEREDVNLFIPYRTTIVNAGNNTNTYDRDLPLNGGVYMYRIRAKEGKGSSEESLSNEIELTQQPIVYIPNAFSPNDDATNETWGVESAYIKTFEVMIYNRWGQLLFTGENANSRWDGRYNGKAVPQDVYCYKIKFTGYDSADVTEKMGTVMVVR